MGGVGSWRGEEREGRLGEVGGVGSGRRSAICGSGGSTDRRGKWRGVVATKYGLLDITGGAELTERWEGAG